MTELEKAVVNMCKNLSREELIKLVYTLMEESLRSPAGRKKSKEEAT